MLIRVSQFDQKTKDVKANRGSHLFGYNNGKSKRTEYSNFIFYSHLYIEIYKGNSEKYKGKIKNQDISVFQPKYNFVEYIGWLDAFLRS